MLIFNLFKKTLGVVIKIIKLYALENIRNTFFEVLPTIFYVLIINLSSQLFLIEEKMKTIDLLTQFLKSMIIVKKMIKMYFNKN